MSFDLFKPGLNGSRTHDTKVKSHLLYHWAINPTYSIETQEIDTATRLFCPYKKPLMIYFVLKVACTSYLMALIISYLWVLGAPWVCLQDGPTIEFEPKSTKRSKLNNLVLLLKYFWNCTGMRTVKISEICFFYTWAYAFVCLSIFHHILSKAKTSFRL